MARATNKIGGTSIKNEGGCRDVRSAKMIETRHGLESNPVPTSYFGPQKGNEGQ